jgi:hypothetical protein
MVKNIRYFVIVLLSFFILGGCASTAYLVQIEAGQGNAAPGNTQPANVLAVVTESHTGAPVTGLAQSDFTVINHFSIPGQKCGFSNNITMFNNVGTGAYHIQVGLDTSIPGCEWVKGKYLTQVMVDSGSKKGQATATLSVK